MLVSTALTSAYLPRSPPPILASDSQTPSPLTSGLPDVDWPTYLGEVTRDASNPAEIELSPSDAGNLTLLWSYKTLKRVESSPAIANGTVYIGSIDGNEYALNASTGALVWKAPLGLSTPNNCSATGDGIVSSATELNGTVFVGGGDGDWDALNSSTGALEWDFYVGNASQGYYNWASPLIANGYAYIGVASQCDSPLVLGGLWKVSLATHIGVFYPTTPSGTVGASIWGSPSFDAATNTVFAATGNPKQSEVTPDSESLLAWNATSFQLIGHWQVPENESGIDSDFGTTPTLLTPGTGTPLVVATNKNGITYALNSSDVDAGPVWMTKVSFLIPCPASSCALQPPNVAPVAYGDGLLYVGSANTTINGVNYTGSIRALYPSNGTAKWVRAEEADVEGAPAYANGLLVVGGGDELQVLNASTGALLWNFSSSNLFVSAPAVAGVIYVGCTDGRVYAFGLQHPPPAFGVTFPETGLPSGTDWGATFAGMAQSTKSTSLSFEEVNGSWSYAISAPAGYVASPGRGRGPPRRRLDDDPNPLHLPRSGNLRGGLHRDGTPRGDRMVGQRFGGPFARHFHSLHPDDPLFPRAQRDVFFHDPGWWTVLGDSRLGLLRGPGRPRRRNRSLYGGRDPHDPVPRERAHPGGELVGGAGRELPELDHELDHLLGGRRQLRLRRHRRRLRPEPTERLSHGPGGQRYAYGRLYTGRSGYVSSDILGVGTSSRSLVVSYLGGEPQDLYRNRAQFLRAGRRVLDSRSLPWSASPPIPQPGRSASEGSPYPSPSRSLPPRRHRRRVRGRPCSGSRPGRDTPSSAGSWRSF